VKTATYRQDGQVYLVKNTLIASHSNSYKASQLSAVNHCLIVESTEADATDWLYCLTC